MSRLNLRPVYVNSTTTQAAPPIISNTAPLSQSLAASFNTVSTNVLTQDCVCYQINITTTNSTGTFYLQTSNDDTNYVDVGTAALVAAANDIAICEFDSSRSASYVRLRYAAGTAGTGTCTIMLAAKQLGGS